jgi:hypothetical protein
MPTSAARFLSIIRRLLQRLEAALLYARAKEAEFLACTAKSGKVIAKVFI